MKPDLRPVLSPAAPSSGKAAAPPRKVLFSVRYSRDVMETVEYQRRTDRDISDARRFAGRPDY